MNDQQTKGHGSSRNSSWIAQVRGNGISKKRVAAYLPRNAIVTGGYTEGDGKSVVTIAGYDDAGWTFEDYVKPRLASGNMFAEKV